MKLRAQDVLTEELIVPDAELESLSKSLEQIDIEFKNFIPYVDKLNKSIEESNNLMKPLLSKNSSNKTYQELSQLLAYVKTQKDSIIKSFDEIKDSNELLKQYTKTFKESI